MWTDRAGRRRGAHARGARGARAAARARAQARAPARARRGAARGARPRRPTSSQRVCALTSPLAGADCSSDERRWCEW